MVNGVKEGMADAGPAPRKQHYAFAFEFLPWSASNKPENTLSLAVDIPPGVLKTTWERHAEQFPATERVKPTGLKGEQIRYQNHALVLITMPAPIAKAEAYFVGIAYTKKWIDELKSNNDTKPSVRCFLFSKNGDEATLREKNETFHGGLEYFLPPTRSTFLLKVGEHLKDQLEVPLVPETAAPPKSPPPLSEKSKPAQTNEPHTEQVHCTALMEAAHPKIYRENGFRIAGLHVDASPKELSKHADKLKVLDQIGYGHAANTAAFPLDPLPSLDQIREAMQRMKDPEKRLIDEFFWFWPEAFRESLKDEALQALASGDGARAYDIWTERKHDPEKSAIAYHNLAVLMHMLALDWTRSYIDSTPDEEAAKRIGDYWRRANRYWKRTCDNDSIWDVVKGRIRTLDDERLTTGFGRRMRKVLPEALCIINASLALDYAEQEKTDYAKMHLGYAQDSGLNGKRQEKVFGAVLAPLQKRLLQAAHAIDAEAKPATKLEMGLSLANEAASKTQLFDFFYGTASEQRTELFDQVSLACVNGTSVYTNDNEVNDTCLQVLKVALSFSHRDDLRERINKFIKNVETGLRRQQLAPFFDMFKTIQDSKAAPAAKLTKIKEYVMPKVMVWVEKEGPKSELSDELLDGVAILLRDISIEAFNEHRDIDTSQEASNLAVKLGRSPEVKEVLSKDQAHLKKVEVESSLQLPLASMKGVLFEINKTFCRFNRVTIPCPEVNGIMFGIVNHYTNQTHTSTSFLISIHGAGSKTITVPLISNYGPLGKNNPFMEKILQDKYNFKAEDREKDDYVTIINALYTHIVPGLLMRLTEKIMAGHEHRIGEVVFTSRGIKVTTGALLWKEEKLVPYELMKYEQKNGSVHVYYPTASGKLSILQSLDVRSHWNAVILEDLIKSVIKRQK